NHPGEQRKSCEDNDDSQDQVYPPPGCRVEPEEIGPRLDVELVVDDPDESGDDPPDPDEDHHERGERRPTDGCGTRCALFLHGPAPPGHGCVILCSASAPGIPTWSVDLPRSEGRRCADIRCGPRGLATRFLTG